MNIQRLFENLEKHRFKPVYCQTRRDAIQYVLNLIPPGAECGIGGSRTVNQLDLDTALVNNGVIVNSHSKFDKERMGELYERARLSEYYISSANALTEDGKIINTDGTANRISSLLFGPKIIIYLVGINKLVKDIPQGLERIKNIAAPLNCKRLNKQTPCVTNGTCCDSTHPDCICKATTIMHTPTRLQEKVYVLVINEELGF